MHIVKGFVLNDERLKNPPGTGNGVEVVETREVVLPVRGSG